nr:hypothetical protein [Mycoplasmopsis bovis]
MVDNNLLNRPEFMNNGIFHMQKIYDVFKKVFNSAKNYKSEYWKNENAKNYNEKLLAKIRPVIDNAFGIQDVMYNVNIVDYLTSHFSFSLILKTEKETL